MTKISAPLGSNRSRYAPRLPGRQRQALDDVAAWMDTHPGAFVSFSGGKDSLVCLDLARRVNPDAPVVFFDSGLEYPQTLRYIERLTNQWGLNLHRYPAEPSALTVLADNGTWEYGARKTTLDVLHHACVTRPSRRAVADHGKYSIIGLRADESASRRALLSQTQGHLRRHERDGTLVEARIAPIWRWSWDEVYAYIGQRGLPMNPVYRELARLGEPERRIRVGLIVDGWALERGRWALARQVAPDLCRLVESHLPALAHWR